MRSEHEMMNLIMNKAKGDDRIRAVIMNGSRANPNAPKDFFQDYDIVYIVRDIASFTCDHGWIKIFGEMMILQMPNTMGIISDHDDGSFIYLMQFMDGNRIDLNLVPVEKADQLIERDSESILLLDKDGIIEPFLPASDADYIIKRPTGKVFADCCNEFWWLCPYVAKGIWRDELPYTMMTYDMYVRDMLMKMLKWHIGIRTGFTVSEGKCGKYFKKLLEPEMWDMYAKTYSDGNYEHMWEALFTAGNLFRIAANKVAGYFGYEYPSGDDERVTAHLKLVRNLPKSASEMY